MNTQQLMDKCGVAWFDMEVGANLHDKKGDNLGVHTNVIGVIGYNGGLGIGLQGDAVVQFSKQVVPLGKKSIRLKVKTSQTTNGTIINTGVPSSGSTAYGFYIGVIQGKLALVHYYGDTITKRVNIRSNKSINDDKWHDILFTWDGSTNANAVKIYIDDMRTPDISGTFPVSDTIAHSSNMTIGRTNNTSYYEYFSGYLDDIEIYNDVINVYENKMLFSLNEKTHSFTKRTKKLNPIMNSNTAPSGTATASSVYDANYSAWKAFDGKNTATTDGWVSANNTLTGWISYEFPSKVNVNKYTLTSRNFQESTPKTWDLLGSYDGLTWELLHSVAGERAWGLAEKREYFVNTNKKYKIFKIDVKELNYSSIAPYVSIGELEFIKEDIELLKINSELNEKKFFNYGLDEISAFGKEINSIGHMTTQSTLLGGGKIYKHSIDLNKYKGKKIYRNE